MSDKKTTSSLAPLRGQIDQLDRSILNLLQERGRLVKHIGEIKEKSGASVFAPGRERDLFQRLKKENSGDLPWPAVENVFREIVSACRGVQQTLRVAYFGPEATFTHMAAIKSFGRQAHFLPCRTITDVFQEVEKNRADYGVVPIENSSEGVVNHTLDMFIESDLKICAELEMPIGHYLVGQSKPGRALHPRVLYSHPQVLGQCRQWIEKNLPATHLVESRSTAEAAQKAVKEKDAVAITSKLAAELYKLNILAEHIEDAANNFTRFLVIGRVEPEPTGRDKTSVMFSIKDKVGALAKMLVPFRRYGLNLTKIESRPTRQRVWEYIFFVDMLGHQSDKRLLKALNTLEKSCVFLKVLGSFPRSD